MENLGRGSKNKLHTKINVEGNQFIVPDHWFWKEYNSIGWERDTLNTFKKHIDTNTHFIDIGAWLGVTSLYAMQCGCKKINAVEANPKSYALMCKMLKWNNLQDLIDIKQICITDKNGEIVKFGKATSSASRILQNGEYTVSTQTLFSYIQEIIEDTYKHFFLKVDIEGSESLIIDQIDNLFKIYKIKVFLALHPQFWSNKNEVIENIRSYFRHKTIFLSSGKQISINILTDMLYSTNKYPEWGTKFGNFFEVLVHE